MKNFLLFFCFGVFFISTTIFYSCSKDEAKPVTDNLPLGWRSGSITQLTDYQYQNMTINEFDEKPELTIEGDPGNDVSIEIEGWGQDSVVVVTITNVPYTTSSLSANSSTYQDLEVNLSSGSNSYPFTTHYLIQFGCSCSHNEFTIQFDNRSTGTWVFRKGTS